MDQEFVLIHDPTYRVGHKYIGTYSSRTAAETVAYKMVVDFRKEQKVKIEGKTIIVPGREFEGKIMTLEEYKRFVRWEQEDILEQEEIYRSGLLDGEYFEQKERNKIFCDEMRYLDEYEW